MAVSLLEARILCFKFSVKELKQPSLLPPFQLNVWINFKSAFHTSLLIQFSYDQPIGKS